MKKLIFLLMIIAAFSCKPDYEEINFQGLENIKVEKVTSSNITLSADAQFYNPNGQKLTLKNVDVEILIKEEVVGHINQELNVAIAAKSDFEVPLKVSFSLKKLNFYGGIFDYLAGNAIKTGFKGNMKVSYFGVLKTVPIDYQTELNLR